MRNSTTVNDNNEVVAQKPKNATLELIRQYARVCTPLTSIAFPQLIAN